MQVTESGTLLENEPVSSPFLRFLGHLISYVLHPIFLIGWISYYLLFINPSVFVGMDSYQKTLVLLRIFSTGIFLPLMTVLLLKGLKFIDSIQLKTQRERIIPYVACITFFFWNYYVSKKLGDPVELRSFLLGLFITACASLIINNYFKVSMHAIGAGGLFALFSVLLFANRLEEGIYLLLAFLLAGLTCTARFIVSDHRPFEVYFGFFAGLSIQIFSWYFLN